MISIGNKCDLREVKQVDFTLANKWAQKEKGRHAMPRMFGDINVFVTNLLSMLSNIDMLLGFKLSTFIILIDLGLRAIKLYPFVAVLTQNLMLE